MSVVAEFGVPIESFVLSDAMESSPSVELDIVRVAGSRTILTPFLRAFGDSIDRFERALAADASIGSVTVLDERSVPTLDGNGRRPERLFRVRWVCDDPEIVQHVSREQGAILHAIYAGTGGWELSALLPDRSTISTLQEHAMDDGIAFDLREVYPAREVLEQGTYTVTDEQREALIAAYRSGYFEVPRERTLSDIAADLDISANALSARLRRGHRRLLANTLAEDE